jgi:hypothetical protein
MEKFSPKKENSVKFKLVKPLNIKIPLVFMPKKEEFFAKKKLDI